MKTRTTYRLTGLAFVVASLFGAVAAVQAAPAVINIEAPVNGVSHNRFNNFNVQPDGTVLNNSNVAGRSELAGQLGANPKLRGGRQADVILMEVNALGNRTRLRGPLESFGGRSDVIVANPNGIIVDGLRTINVRSLSLIDGSSAGKHNLSFVNGNGKGKNRVDGVVVRGNGADLGGLDYFDVVASTLNLRGPLHDSGAESGKRKGARVGLHAGVESYKFEGKPATAKQIYGQEEHDGYGNTVQKVVLSAAAAGSMYGDAVFISAYGEGAGVSLKNAIRSSNEIMITAEGQIEVQDLESRQGDIRVGDKAADVQVHGNVSARNGVVDINGRNVESIAGSALQAKNIKLTALRVGYESEGGDLTINGKVEAQGDVDTEARRVVVGKDGRLVALGGNRMLAIKQIDNLGTISGAERTLIHFKQSGHLNNSGFIGSELGNVMIRYASTVENSGIINAAKLLALSTYFNGSSRAWSDQRVNNSGTMSAGGSIRLMTDGGFTNLDGGLVSSKRGDIDIRGGKSVHLNAGSLLQVGIGQQINLKTPTLFVPYFNTQTGEWESGSRYDYDDPESEEGLEQVTQGKVNVSMSPRFSQR